METDKLLLEIYGKVESTAVNVAHIMAEQKSVNERVEKLHKRVDRHSHIISWITGACVVIGVGLRMAWEWAKTRWNNGL